MKRRRTVDNAPRTYITTPAPVQRPGKLRPPLQQQPDHDVLMRPRSVRQVQDMCGEPGALSRLADRHLCPLAGFGFFAGGVLEAFENLPRPPSARSLGRMASDSQLRPSPSSEALGRLPRIHSKPNFKSTCLCDHATTQASSPEPPAMTGVEPVDFLLARALASVVCSNSYRETCRHALVGLVLCRPAPGGHSGHRLPGKATTLILRSMVAA